MSAARSSLLDDLRPTRDTPKDDVQPTYRTASGRLFQADCLEVLAELDDESVDLVFADPPFNLGKVYGAGIDDSLDDDAVTVRERDTMAQQRIPLAGLRAYLAEQLLGA